MIIGMGFKFNRSVRLFMTFRYYSVFYVTSGESVFVYHFITNIVIIPVRMLLEAFRFSHLINSAM